MRKFYTVRDIEDMVASGKKVMELDSRSLLTDEAREKARKLGLNIKTSSAKNSQESTIPLQESTVPATGKFLFYTAYDIQQFVESGTKEIEIDTQVKLTDEALERARKLGLTVKKREKRVFQELQASSGQSHSSEKTSIKNESTASSSHTPELPDRGLATQIKSAVTAQLRTDDFSELLDIIIPMVLSRL